MRAVLMRDGDYYVSLGARVAKARRARADLQAQAAGPERLRPGRSRAGRDGPRGKGWRFSRPISPNIR